MVLERTIRQIVSWYEDDGETRPLVLNFCLSNGRGIVASRFAINAPDPPTLYCCRGSGLHLRDGLCRVEPVRAGRDNGCVLIASERMSDDSPWQSIDDGRIVTVDADHDVSTRTIEGLEPSPAGVPG
jgi:predicted glutamine amidotransferase